MTESPMAIRTTVEPISDFIELAVSDMLSPRAQSRAVADFARERLGEAQQINQRVLGRVPPHQTFVDGRTGAALESVKPNGGVIVFEFELVSDLIKTVLAALRDASPVVSGDYRNGHTAFINGAQVTEIPATLSPTDEILIANPVPYARRIEIGVTKSGRPFVVQMAPRIYQRVAAAMQARFGNIAKIKSDGGAGVLLSGAYTIKGVVGRGGISSHYIAKGGARKRRRLHAGEQVKSPAIFITLN